MFYLALIGGMICAGSATECAAQPPGDAVNYIWNYQNPPLGQPQSQMASLAMDGSVISSFLYVGPVWIGQNIDRQTLFADHNGVEVGTVAAPKPITVHGDGVVSGSLVVGPQSLSVVPLTGTGPPSGQAALGQIYIDTDAQDGYMFVGSWKRITEGPVATRESSWGGIKAGYR